MSGPKRQPRGILFGVIEPGMPLYCAGCHKRALFPTSEKHAAVNGWHRIKPHGWLCGPCSRGPLPEPKGAA